MQDKVHVFDLSLLKADRVDQEWMERRLLLLEKELLDGQIFKVSPVRTSEERSGAKSLGGVMVSLLVTLTANDFFLEQLFRFLTDWAGRQKGIEGIEVKHGDLELKISGSTSTTEVLELINKIRGSLPEKA